MIIEKGIHLVLEIAADATMVSCYRDSNEFLCFLIALISVLRIVLLNLENPISILDAASF
jgi:hypothetical protein